MGFSQSQIGSLTGGDGEIPKDASDDERANEARPSEELGNESARELSHSTSMNKARFIQLNHALHGISRLQSEATATQISARETRRNAVLKRRDVWFWDGKFMGEVQKLLANAKLTGFDELIRLADSCQSARDELGPVEQENMEAELRWEGQTWKLQQAEEELRTEFASEFRDAETCSITTTASISGRSEESADTVSDGELEIEMSDMDDIHANTVHSVLSSTTSHFRVSRPNSPIQIDEAFSQESILNDLITHHQAAHGAGETTKGWDSAIEDIDGPLEHLPPSDSIGPSVSLPKRDYASLEMYPQLLSDFTSGRDRINRWLKNISLTSRLEALSLFTGLRIQLEADKCPIPSNWAQLVVAFWELDGAAIPGFRQNSDRDETNQKANLSMAWRDSTAEVRRYVSVEPGTKSMISAVASINGEPHVANTQNLEEYETSKGVRGIFPQRPGLSGSFSPAPPSPPRSQQAMTIEIDHEKTLEEPP